MAESTPQEADDKAAVSTEEARIGHWYPRFIRGELGLAWTFWYHGMLMLFLLQFAGIASHAIDHSGNLAFAVSVFTVAYLCTLHVAIWRAGQKYKGSQAWTFLAQLVVIIAIIRLTASLFVFLTKAKA